MTLGIDRFYVLGWSAGGPYALACAYKLPERVIAGAIVSGLAPPNRPNLYEGLHFPNRMLMFFVKRVPKIAYLFRRLMYRMIKGNPDDVGKKLASTFPPEDRKLLEIPENLLMLVTSIQEGFRQGWIGPAHDDIIILNSWDFPLEDIKVRIDIWQGEVDKNVPINHGKYQNEMIPKSRLTILPGQAHMYLLVRWREVLGSLIE